MEVVNDKENDDPPTEDCAGDETALLHARDESPTVDVYEEALPAFPLAVVGNAEALGDANGATPADALAVKGVQVPPAIAEFDELNPDPSVELNQHLFVSKCVSKRGSTWHACIPAKTTPPYVKMRFLGIFDDEAEAHQACLAAISDASHSGLSSTATAVKQNKSSLSSKTSLWSLSQSSPEGSCTSDLYYHDLSDDGIVEEINAMTRVCSILGHPLRDWTHCSAQQHPPCFGRLCFSDGAHIDVTTLACLMGKADASCSQLLAALGDCQGGNAAGLHFRCAADPRSVGSQSDQKMIPAMHIDSHPSIAKCHAYLRWNFKLGDFQVLALSPVGIYVNGLKILPEHGPQMLHSRSILQMGCRIMYFVRPRTHSPECTQRPVEQRQALLSSIAELVGLRQPMHPTTGQEEPRHHPQEADKMMMMMQEVDLLRTGHDSMGGEVEMQGSPVNCDPTPAPASTSRHELVDHAARLDGIALLLEASAKRSDGRS